MKLYSECKGKSLTMYTLRITSPMIIHIAATQDIEKTKSPTKQPNSIVSLKLLLIGPRLYPTHLKPFYIVW